jgi:hypothetical protein
MKVSTRIKLVRVATRHRTCASTHNPFLTHFALHSFRHCSLFHFNTPTDAPRVREREQCGWAGARRHFLAAASMTSTTNSFVSTAIAVFTTCHPAKADQSISLVSHCHSPPSIPHTLHSQQHTPAALLQVPGAFAAAADENQMGGGMMGKASKRGALGELAGMGKKALTKVCLCPLRAPRLSRTNN